MGTNEIDISKEPIEKQLEFWQSFVEGLGKGLYELQKYRKEEARKFGNISRDIARVLELLEGIENATDSQSVNKNESVNLKACEALGLLNKYRVQK